MINSAITKRFQRNLMRKLAADYSPPPEVIPVEDADRTGMEYEDWLNSGDPNSPLSPYVPPEVQEQARHEAKVAAIKATLKAYTPYVGGGAALGALLGGGIGYGVTGAKNKNRGTLLGALIGGGIGAGGGALGKYLYDKHQKK